MNTLTLGNFSKIKENWFSVALIFFICNFYFAPSSKFLHNVFFIFILFPFCIHAFQHRTYWRTEFSRYKVYIGLCGALLLSSIVNFTTFKEFGHEFSQILYVTGFIGAIALTVRDNPNILIQLLRAISYAGFLGAIICICAEYYQNGNLSNRLTGWGVMENPIVLSSIYAFSAFSSIHMYISSKINSASSWRFLVLVIPPISVVLLTQSRGPLLALIIASAAYFLITISIRAIIIGAISIATITTIVLLNTDIHSRLLSLDGARPAIWEQALKKISNKPLLGHGLQETKRIDALAKFQTADGRFEEKVVNFLHPHSVYLTTLLHGGILALIIFGAVIFSALYAKEITIWHFLLLFGLIYMTFDGSRLFDSPKELWLINWLPLGILLAQRTRNQRQA